jgi:hypothetical protein
MAQFVCDGTCTGNDLGDCNHTVRVGDEISGKYLLLNKEEYRILREKYEKIVSAARRLSGVPVAGSPIRWLEAKRALDAVLGECDSTEISGAR